MKAPLFTLPHLTNPSKQYHLSDDINNKIILITFWVSWCPDCSVDLPKKENIYKHIEEEKIKIISINVSGRERSEEDAIQYTNKFLSQITLKDDGRKVYDMFSCTGVPTTVLIDLDGNIAHVFDDKSDFLTIITFLGRLLRDM